MWQSLISMSNPGPSACGLGAIVLGIFLSFYGNAHMQAWVDKIMGAGLALLGLGAMMSRQNNVSSEEVGIKPKNSDGSDKPPNN